MRFVPALLARIARCRKGASAIEYAVLIALIACAITIGLMGMGANVKGTMSSVQNELPANKVIDIQTNP